MLDAQKVRDERVAARLRQHAVARIDQDDGKVGRRCAGRHVARVLLVAGRIGDDELPLRRREVTVRDVDRDALFALGAEAVGQKSKIDMTAAAVCRSFGNAGKLVLVDALRIVKQASDERTFAVIDAAGCGKTQETQARSTPRAS